MPARVRLTLLGPVPWGPHQHADGLRALVLAAVRRTLPPLAAAIHDANQPNPLTVGSLITTDDPQTHTVEIGCVADEVLLPLLRGLPKPRGRIVLGRIPYDVGEVEVTAQASFESLMASPLGNVIRLRMLTPTAHHAPGPVRLSIVTPDPYLYVGSWFRRWNLYAPAPMEETLMDAVREQLAVRYFDGGTTAARLSQNRTFIGFTGRVEFAILKGPTDSSQIAAAVGALARLAEYCGTGVETMRGMGQTRLMEPSD